MSSDTYEEKKPLLQQLMIPTISIDEETDEIPRTHWLRRPSLSSIASCTLSDLSSQ